MLKSFVVALFPVFPSPSETNAASTALHELRRHLMKLLRKNKNQLAPSSSVAHST